MKKTIFFSLAVLTAWTMCLFVVWPAQEPIKPIPTISVVKLSEEELIEKEIVIPSVQIVTNKGGGSGIIIYQDTKVAYIITANHVVKNATEFWAHKFFKDIVQFEPLKVIFQNADTDIAILESPPIWTETARIASSEELKLFTHCFIYGYPHAFYMPVNGILTEGRVSILQDLSLCGMEQTVVTAPASFGNSGGGMFILVNGHYKMAGIARCIAQINPYAFMMHTVGCSTPEQIADFLQAFHNRK